MRLTHCSLLLFVPSLSFGQSHWEILADSPIERFNPVAASDDGTVLLLASDQFEPFRWTAEEGAMPLTLPAGGVSNPICGMNSDGSRIFCNAVVQGMTTVISWTGSVGAVELPLLPQSLFPEAHAISRDGSTVVGSIRMDQGVIRAVRWVGANTVDDLGSLGGDQTWATDVSADGSAIVGTAEDSAGQYRAFRWTAASGLVDLVFPAANHLGGVVSRDGSVVFGSTLEFQGLDQVIRWTSASGPVVLASASTNSAEFGIIDISSDGTAALWASLDPFNSTIEHFYWSSTTGVLPVGSDLRLAALSSDGSTATGFAMGPAANQAIRWSPSFGLEVLGAQGSLSAGGMLINEDASTVIGSSRGGDLTRWRSSSEVGLPYCGPAQGNSSGQPAEIVARGTNATQPGQLDLVASSIPQQTFGFFLASPVGTPATPVVQSQGRICLGGAIGRFVGPGQILNSGIAGELNFAVPVMAIATPLGSVNAQQGESWFFQAWFRDANPTPTSNFTNGVQVTFY
jgi:probable HAF family extracellular repeat protein